MFSSMSSSSPPILPLGRTSVKDVRRENFRQKLRDKCLIRIRNERAHLHDQARHRNDLTKTMEQVHAIAAEEMNSFMDLDTMEWDEDNPTIMPDTQEWLDFQLKLEEDIQAELKREEAELLQQMLDFEAAEITETVRLHLEHGNDAVVCPVCVKSYLLLTERNVLVCRCGLRINLKFDGLTLPMIAHRLRELTSEHSRTCHSIPTFHQPLDGLLDGLVMQCSSCGSFAVVL